MLYYEFMNFVACGRNCISCTNPLNCTTCKEHHVWNDENKICIGEFCITFGYDPNISKIGNVDVIPEDIPRSFAH